MDIFASEPTHPAAQLHRINWFIGDATVSFDLECLHEELPAGFFCDKEVADEERDIFIESFAGDRTPLRDGVIESHWTGSGEDAELWWKYASGPVADAAEAPQVVDGADSWKWSHR